MTLLFVFKSAGYMRHFGDTIRLLLQRGHVVHVRIAAKNDFPEYLDALRLLAEQYRNFSTGIIERSNSIWVMGKQSLRMALDCLRYHDPRFRSAYSLRERAGEYAPQYIQLLARRGLLKSPWVYGATERFLQRLERAAPLSRESLRTIEETKPDVVLITPLVDFGSTQVDFVKAARVLGVPSALCVASWDNLSNKGLMRVVPDFVTVWNDVQKEEAITLHGARPSQVFVTGAQTFDHWFSWRPSCTAEAFRERLGVSTTGPLLLYLGSSKSIAPQEASFVKAWVESIRNSPDPVLRDAAIVCRPHPKNAQQWERFDPAPLGNVAVFPRGGMLVESPQARADFFDSLFHSAAIVGLNTTAMIEAAILEKPVLVPVFPNVEATRRGTVGTVHFEYLARAADGLVAVADSPERHLAQLAAALRDPLPARSRARQFVRSFVRPCGEDVPAAERVVAAVERMAAPRVLPQPAFSLSLLPYRVALWLLAIAATPSVHRHAWKFAKVLARRSRKRLSVRELWLWLTKRMRRLSKHLLVLKRWRKDALRAWDKSAARSISGLSKRRTSAAAQVNRLREGVRRFPNLTKRVQLEDMYYLVRFGGFRLLIVDVKTAQYGHAAYEILIGLEIARKVGARVYLLKPRKPANEALFRLASDHVHVIEPNRAGDLVCRQVVSLWWIVRALRRVRGTAQAARLAETPERL